MALLESVFNHLVLPPKLPGQRDTDTEGIEYSILTRLMRACDTLSKLADPELAETWASLRHSLQVCLNVNQGRLEKASMLREFSALQPKHLLILHVVEQNAALLIRRHLSDGVDTVIFEAFEASPSSEDVLAAENALQWEFPGRAAEIPVSEFVNESFQENLATFLEQASMESLKRFAAHSVKAKTSVIETRDTTDPALVTQMLMPLIEAVGSSIDVPRLEKRVRDNVNIQNAEFSWRRLPFWLILRVATGRQLCLTLGNKTGRACYKFLVCTVLAQLLEDCAGQLAPELTMILRAKLCRRLAKLEMDKNRIESASAVYQQLFGLLSPLFREIIGKVTEQVESAWSNFKRTILRPIPRLPPRADEQALHLSLPNSGRYLTNVLALPDVQKTDSALLSIPPIGDTAIEQVKKFTDRYFNLARLDSEIETEILRAPGVVVDNEARCLELAESIADLFTAVESAYVSNPEQMSIFILNLFDLWVQMDKCAVTACPLLREYHPVFTPNLLDVLHLPILSGMQRLQDIQIYLRDRCRNCRLTSKTIFSEPEKECFAVGYLKQSPRLRSLQQQIENASTRLREKKETEWRNACEEYDVLSKKISDSTCVCSFDLDGSRNVRGCTKCWHWRCRKRMKITIHEDFLPKDSAKLAAVVFELGIPSYLAAYRNATWRIFSDLGHPSKPSVSLQPVMLLKDYSQLQRYMERNVNGISLASAKKSFLQTHFRALKMKVDLSDISFPLALDFLYYDARSGIWLKDLEKPLTFQHLCGINVPRGLQNSVMRPSIHPAPNNDGPSSYMIMASQTKCPSDMSVHEFMSYQRLLSGKIRRWLTMLVELGASNLNFSNEDTMLIFSQLAVQAGPAENGTTLLRDTHLVFQDQSFCQRLAEQIDNRLRNISSNWRETNCMEMLITLSLRLFSLTSGPDRQSAEKLLRAARDATLQWICRLRDEVRNAIEADALERAARYGFLAALLCRRTFTTFVGSNSEMDAGALCSFVQASVALQENLVVDLANLPQNIKNMLVRDIKMAYQIQSLIRQSIQSNPDSLGTAINNTWYDSANSIGRIYSPWQFFPFPNNRWVMSIITSTANKFIVSQVVHYNFVEGHLLVDGKPLGRLPGDIRESEDVKELFGNQHLLTFPSSLSGMIHATHIPGHEIHFGFREKSVIIRAITMDGLLEYVPRRVFMDNDSYDLPLALIENCVHWLNLRSKRLEIRRKPVIWKTRKNDWILDVFNRRAQRSMVLLVDPHSDLCKRVAGIFRHFEDAQRLTVFQALRGKLSVELRRLELSFFVNRSSLLECRELQAEIDPNQDAGTLYGFESKIVLRDVANVERRSIITALGALTYRRHGMHVAVQASSSHDYGRFGIDDVLRRLSCPPEPRLIYSKAQFHAFTSFVLPDPLTGRTGTEEALHTLRSGYCQPWTPMADTSAEVLKVIKSLSPSREYYPRDKRRLQTVSWDENLTVTIQHDSYELLVKEILTKSDLLRAFALHNEEAINFNIEAPSHLQRRGEIHRLTYEGGISNSGRLTTGKDTVYKPRDRQASLPQATNIYQIVRLVRNQPFGIHIKCDLAGILHGWKFIGGFHDTIGSVSSCLSDLIEDNISEQWGNLVNLCRHTKTQDSYKVIFLLSLLSFGKTPNIDIVRSLAAFSCLDELKSLKPPLCSSFVGFKLHESPTIESLLNLIAADYPIFEPNPNKTKAQQALAQEKHQILRDLCEDEGRNLALFLLEQWPSSKLSVEKFESTVIDVELACERILPEWQRLHQNWELSEYVIQVQEILNHSKGARDMLVPRAWNESAAVFRVPNRGSVIPSLSRDLLVKCGPLPWNHLPHNHELHRGKELSRELHYPNELNKAPSKEVIELDKILALFARSPNVLRQQYGNDLKKSLTALKNISSQPKLQEMPPSVKIVTESIEKARVNLNDQFDSIQNALSAEDDRFQWLQLGKLWPYVTPIILLEQLRSSSNHQFGNNMRESLVSYGRLTTTLQRLLRIKDAQLKEKQHKVLEEWQSIGHENWSPVEFPDWLLLEIDSDILIRHEQIDVAYAIISPVSQSNSVLQMNMGKGKTSCIVPMAAAILADKKQLLRLIVPKALLLQTAQTMQSRLGGLVGREIRHIPFTRRTLTTPNMLQLYFELHRESLRSCGVILTIPEHILSYKLSGLQRLADLKLKEAQGMIEFQSWLSYSCRDVLDESDFTLAVKTQLIYPSGQQTSVDGHPHRWKVAQSLLSLVEDHLPDLQRDFPRSIEVVKRPYGFPMVHFLQTDVEDALHSKIINDICDGQASFLRFADSKLPVNTVELKRVLSEGNLDPKLLKKVSRFFADKSSACKKILLVRGLLLNRILLLCLKKRWNVQYGLHPNRHPIAVPFEAKGVPSEQAEFGHPDVAILFTCLAFYYSGLNVAQFCEGLQHILRSDDPAAEYDRWTYGSDTLPEALYHWNVINVDDQAQVEELWRHLRLNRNVLDYYMNNFVFPIHAKQFGVKLQASGWDLPWFSKSRVGEKETSSAKTTGFSGTNDNKMMLPLTIKQDDLPSLCQTNAEVLTYLLEDRNRQYNLAAWQGKRLTEEGLLRKIVAMRTRILIDAGAYILEMDNRTLVKSWLDIDTQAKGAVYFGADNRAWVQYRGGKERVPLLATPFAENLEGCLVYLDEAHTRGIDLKLPQNARGALTLALGQTKDHTMQAAMRLRQLGSTQSVAFFAPPEVHQSILDLCQKRHDEIINSSHVVSWLLEQTCRTNEQLQNLYLAQGTDFCRRMNAQWENPKFSNEKDHREAYLKVIQLPDRQTLEQLYGGMAVTQSNSLTDLSSTELKDFVKELSKQRQAANNNGNAIHSSALEEVEQEREVEFQVEEVRQVQKPTHYKALSFPGLHTAVSCFATTGSLTGGQGYEHAFTALTRTSIGQKYSVCRTTSRLFVSAEFMRTIELGAHSPNDNFLRPVEWILWSPSNETALIIISEEAELLIPIIRTESQQKVHLIAYTAPITKNMLHFNKLSYYVLPRLPVGYKMPDWFSIELGIFAGRLYIDFSECAPLVEYLQLADKTDAGTLDSNNEHAVIFTKKPLDFLLEWLTLCRKGQDVMHTPMGYVCQGRQLHKGHPFFVARKADTEEAVAPSVEDRRDGRNIDGADDEDTDLEDEWDPMDDLG